jgi:glycosyltransferase involved in cell wall biosynthesis
MRVLLLNRSYYPHVGGIENSLYYLSREYRKLGNDVSILTEEILEDYPHREEYAEIITYPRQRVNKLFLPFVPLVNEGNVKRWIEEHKSTVEADMIICRDPMMGLAYLEVFPKANMVYIPAVVIEYYNKGIRQANSLQNFIKEILRYSQLKIEELQQKKIMDLSQKVVVFSNNVRNQLLRGQLCQAKKITVCHPGVADKFVLQDSIYDEAETADIRFVFVGRLVLEKNLEMLIEAFSQLHCERKKLILVGDGDQRSNLEKQVKRLALENDVIFVGKSNEPEKYYRESHFLVLPSSYESFGQVIIEALSLGVPVIGFSTIEGKTLTAIDELIDDGENGFVCKEFNCNSLKIGMQRAVEAFHDKERYYSMRNKSTAFTVDNCSWSNLAQVSGVKKA